MKNGVVRALFICPAAGEPMTEVREVRAIAGQGLEGDRYTTGSGSWNRGKPGTRQVTLMNALFFEGSGFTFEESRRNIIVEGVELMWMIGRGDFTIGGVRMRAVKYCDPCERPNTLAKKKESFREAFFDRGGLIAEVIEGGVIKLGDAVTPPPRS